MTALSALVGAQGAIGGYIGFEPATRAMRLIMASKLNDEIDAQASRWEHADLALQDLGFDAGVGQVEVEHVEKINIFEGPHTSYLFAPPEGFPTISLMAFYTQATPGSSAGDQYDTSQLTLAVETFVKAGPVPKGVELAYETIVHRRIQRTTEAVNAVMRRDPMLMGTVMPVPVPPRGGIDQVMWMRRDDKNTDRHMIQGSRLEYRAERAASFG